MTSPNLLPSNMEEACPPSSRPVNRGRRFFLGAAIMVVLLLATNAQARTARRLPDEKVFVGKDRFEKVYREGIRAGWAKLPLNERITRIGLALVGTPYLNYTLELDERIETPCANFKGMDCWTFFEIALAMARTMAVSEKPDPSVFLRFIEMDRYRGGRCDGTFTSRLHHLEDWIQDNQRRDLVLDITPRLPGAARTYRRMSYMGGPGYKNFRQLRANPALVSKFTRIEDQLSKRGIWYVPNRSVPSAERQLRNGDIICIVTNYKGAYTSHVGLAYRDKAGVLRFMHASRNEKKVIIDSRLSTYLNKYKTHAGIMVARPLDAPH